VPPKSEANRTALGELARLFLRLGLTAFGGPAAHIAMMEDEVVRRRSWLTHAEFLDLLGATNLIPGPNSTEMAIHIGHRRAGFPGLVVAGSCFIAPAMLLVGFVAWAYVKFGRMPEVPALLYGIKPVIIAIVLQALWRLGKSALKSKFLALLAAVVAVGSFLHVNELLLLLAAGLCSAMRVPYQKIKDRVGALALIPGTLPGLLAAQTAPIVGGTQFTLPMMFLFFLKVGSVLFGSGYVLLAFLRSDLVLHWGWLTEGQLLDAISVGQFTPGPVFTTATFIGYLLGGVKGAALATLGIFLPAFLFVALSGPLIPRLRHSGLAGAALDGVNSASLALMAVVTIHLSRAAIVDMTTVLLALIAAFLLIRFKLNSAWLVGGGAACGLLKLFI
jgi:chromate transporter